MTLELPLPPSRPLPDIGPIRKRSNRPSEGKWILVRDRNRIKRNPADRNDFALRPNPRPGWKSTVFSFMPPSVLDDLHRASVFGQYNG